MKTLVGSFDVPTFFFSIALLPGILIPFFFFNCKFFWFTSTRETAAAITVLL